MNEVIAAFDRDGWNVDSKTDVFYHNNGMGVRAHNKTATVGDGGPYKLAYYVQGDWKVLDFSSCNKQLTTHYFRPWDI